MNQQSSGQMIIFVTRLPISVQNEDLETIFGNECSDIHVFTPRPGATFKSGKVTFSSEDAYKKALLKHETKFCGSRLVVRKWDVNVKSSESTGEQSFKHISNQMILK